MKTNLDSTMFLFLMVVVGTLAVLVPTAYEQEIDQVRVQLPANEQLLRRKVRAVS